MKIVINSRHGGYGVSKEGIRHLIKLGYKPSKRELKNLNDYEFKYQMDPDLKRTDHLLIQMVEELGGKKAGDKYAYLEIVEIPDDVDWCIKEYDGAEWVAERHRTWHGKGEKY